MSIVPVEALVIVIPSFKDADAQSIFPPGLSLISICGLYPVRLTADPLLSL